MDTESNNQMLRPLIQVDDLVREMTEEEYEIYLIIQASPQGPPQETPE
jgi:hypothetical protein